MYSCGKKFIYFLYNWKGNVTLEISFYLFEIFHEIQFVKKTDKCQKSFETKNWDSFLFAQICLGYSHTIMEDQPLNFWTYTINPRKKIVLIIDSCGRTNSLGNSLKMYRRSVYGMWVLFSYVLFSVRSIQICKL